MSVNGQKVEVDDETAVNEAWIDAVQNLTSVEVEHAMAGVTEVYSLIRRQHSESVSRGMKQSIALQEQNADDIQRRVDELQVNFGVYKGRCLKLQSTGEALARELEQTHFRLNTAIRLLRLNGIRIPEELVSHF